MIRKKPTIVFDIGGTKTRVGVSWDGKSLTKHLVYRTPQSYEEGFHALTSHIQKLTNGRSIRVIAGGIAGPLDENKSMVVDAPHLVSWNRKPFATDLSNVLKTTVRLENDTSLVGLGEALYGAGADYSVVMYMTVSTGVNAVRIVDGVLEPHLIPQEVGRQIIQIGGPSTLEDFVGGREIQKRYGVSPKNLTNPQAWKEITHCVSVGIYNSILHWSPDIVVVGGGVMKHISITQLQSEVTTLLSPISQKYPVVRRSTLGEVGGLRGALSLVE